MAEFRMPSLGADMESGVLVEWFVAVGDRVERGDVIAAVDTDKAVIDVEVFDSGVVQQLLVEPGTEVPVGEPLAVIGTADAGNGTADAGNGTAGVRQPPSTVEDRQPVRADAGVHHASRVLSPLVRHLADRLGVDLAAVEGTGCGGRVTRADVEHVAAAPPPATATRPLRSVRRTHGEIARSPATPSGRSTPRARRRATELGVDLAHVRGTGLGGAVREADVLAATGPQTGPPEAADRTRSAEDRGDAMRRAIARSMTIANHEIPHYHLSQLTDVGNLLQWLEVTNASRPPATRLLPAAAVLRAVALALRDQPGMNGFWADDAFVPGDGVHLGVATSLRAGGLVVPVLHHADQMDLDEVMSTLRDLVQRTRRGGLRGSDLQDATATVTNLGDRGVDLVHGVIHPPQVALVGTGAITKRPLVADDEVVARPSMFLTLAGDHRASDGQAGSKLLQRVATLLHEPGQL